MHIIGKLMLISTAAKAASFWVPRYRDTTASNAEVDQMAVAAISLPAGILGHELSKLAGGSEKAWTIGGGLGSALLADALLSKRG